MRILFVDNHAEFTATVVDYFLHAHEVVVTPTLVDAKVQFQTTPFDIVLVDYDLDDGKGDELVTWVRSSGSATPLVAVSSEDAGNAALVAAGANVVCAKVDFPKIKDVLKSLVP
jgi:DNA-binding response OmpR family regulator